MPEPSPSPPAWTPDPPSVPGFYEFFDPHHRLHQLMEVRRVRGQLAVRIPRARNWWLPLVAWQRPCLKHSRWRGPLRVPDALPEAGLSGA